ncbi:hypothetical protein LTR85_006315 [Meristemomyces frigidus]|nr:hypothetical protein LTR85_006315 [Meristemomyces frigidus]
MASSSSTSRRVYAFDNPRSCSQLFNKLFEEHPQLLQIFHPLYPASSFGPERIWLGLKHSDAAEEAQIRFAEGIQGPMFSRETYAAACTRLDEKVEEVERQGKVAWIKDHTACCIRKEVILRWLRQTSSLRAGENPTVFTEAFMDSLTPILLIRHPALVIPSWYRKQKPLLRQAVHDEDFRVCTTLAWSRMVFDYYRYQARQGHTNSTAAGDLHATEDGLPGTLIVVDAEDITHNTKPTMEKLCSILHLDPQGVQYLWDPVPDEEIPDDPMRRAFFMDIMKSTGVQQQAKNTAGQQLSLETEMAKWQVEFGEEDAAMLRALVVAEMPNFEYLRQYKISV